MKKLAYGILFIFLQASIFVFAHYSCLQKIEDEAGNDLGNLGGLQRDSNPQDQAGVCYGTRGAATLQEGPFQVLPRCHSEFYLLDQIRQRIPVLAGRIFHIKNQLFPPCKLQRGAINPYTNKTERNPGTPCHQYLTNFARQNICRIIVRYPGGAAIYP